MTREEMIRQAQETRKRVTNAVVPQELLDAYPVELKLRKIPTRVGESDVYDAVTGETEAGGPLIINFHGGGFIRERTKNDEVYCRKLAHAMNCRVWDVDYRIAPDDPFPTALQESYDVVKWAHDHAENLQISPDRILLTGHSAGGNLVCGICMMAKEKGDFQIPAVVTDYPPLDLYTDPAEKVFCGKGIPYERARLYNLYYCDRERQQDPYVSPVFATQEMLAGFPPLLMITAGADDLCTEAEEFALKVCRAGTEVTVKRFAGAGHGFTIYRKDGHEEAFAMIVRFLKSRLSLMEEKENELL